MSSFEEDHIPFREISTTLGPYWNETTEFLSRSKRNKRPPKEYNRKMVSPECLGDDLYHDPSYKPYKTNKPHKSSRSNKVD